MVHLFAEAVALRPHPLPSGPREEYHEERAHRPRFVHGEPPVRELNGGDDGDKAEYGEFFFEDARVDCDRTYKGG